MTSSPELKLKPINVVGFSQVLEIPADGLSFGRDPGNQVVLDGAEFPFISAIHARVDCVDGTLYVEDLDSKNGTLVNGRAIEERTAVKSGDLIQFGREAGATFAVVSSSATDTQTVTLPATAVAKSVSKEPVADFGHTTIIRLRKALGIPEEPAAGDTSPTRRGPAPLTLILFLVLVAGIAIPIYYVVRTQDSVNQELEQSLARAQDQIRAQQSDLDEQLERYQKREGELVARAESLRRRIQEVESTGRGDLDQLRSQLADTNVKLEQYSPLEQARIEQERLRGVLSSIVYIEKRVAYREVDGDRYLHETEVDGTLLRPLESDDLAVIALDSGSGFCVSDTGYIISNAHVIQVEEKHEIDFSGAIISMAPVIDVVFSGTAERYPAEVVAIASTGGDDFAILKITPFEGMPFIKDFRVDRPAPRAGSSVRLFGFPLGKKLIQDLDIMKASVFRGSVSRPVDAYLQVQSAVYPGNSGGPVVDVEGNVVGVVTAVQTLEGGQIASDIGFVLPISRLAKIWPPTSTQ